jgi:redox-sensitive bicupin YhaK (pirin superfamily)
MTLTTSTSSSSAETPVKSSPSPAQVRLRPSLERGYANHGWLDSYHTFSFANYYDPEFEGFGSLRVINEDRVAPGRGFGKHPHRDFEIFSYIVQGALKHDDSLGHSELVKRGQVQFTSTGRGIAHAEMNGSDTDLVHFLQIWVKPRTKGLQPSYHTATFSDEDKLKKWVLVVSPESDANAEGSITVHADCRMYAGLLKHGEQREFVARPNTKLYIHVVADIDGMHGLHHETALRLNDSGNQTLNSGDGAFVTFPDAASQSNSIVLSGLNNHAADGNTKPTEVLIFELSDN